MDADSPFLPTPTAARDRFQFRLGSLFVGVAGIALGLTVWRVGASWLGATLAGASFWIALGLVQQAWDLWGTRSQLTICERAVRWGWRYAILWRVVIALLIGAYWLVESLEAAHVIDLRTLDAEPEFPATASLFRDAAFQLALVIGLSSAPWAVWRRVHQRALSAVDISGWIAGIVFAMVALNGVALITVLVCIAITGIEFSQPYVVGGQIIHDVDPRTIRHGICVLAVLSSSMVGVSIFEFWLARRLARATSGRLAAGVLLLICTLATGAYAVWVHVDGLRSVSPHLADNQVWRPWICWLSAAVLLGLFAFSVALRFHYRGADESQQQPLIIWHRGPGAYLNESRMLMIVLSAVTGYGLWELSYLSSFRELTFDWESVLETFGFLGSPEYAYLSFAVLCLSLHGIFARRRIADRDQRMAPAALRPADFFVTCIFVAAITVGLAEAVAWSSFALWLL